jgi:exopolysaccharide biosynthesis polyprenyl glycosylphosphotransferase
VWVLLLAINHTYERRFLYVGSEETRRVFRSGMMLVAGVAFVSYALQEDFSRGYLLGSFPLLVVGTAIGRYALRKGLHRRRTQGACLERTIVVGHPGPTAAMVERLRRQQHHGLDVVAAALPPGVSTDSQLAETDLPLVRARGIVDAVTELGASVVVVLACPEMDGDELRRLSWRLESTGTQLLVAPALVDVTGPRTSVRLAAGLPLLHMEPPDFSGIKRVAKSVLDRSAAAMGLLLLAPVLLAIMVMIRLDDHGQAVFKQQRVGRHGKEFVLLKFRTMHVDAESRLAYLRQHNEHDGVLFKMRADPRVTRVGRYLRRFSLDELPQLINVLRGEMSLVGPRPPLPDEVSRYDPDLRRRLVVPPGLTGLWQVSGRSDLSWDESMYLDLHYVENWTPALDLMILMKTARAVVQARGAY